MIKKRFIDLPFFNFQAASVADVKKIIMERKTDKALLTNCINESIENGTFPDANITPVYKSNNPFDKANYRPVSILPVLCKMHERLMFNHLSNHKKKDLKSNTMLF